MELLEKNNFTEKELHAYAELHGFGVIIIDDIPFDNK